MKTVVLSRAEVLSAAAAHIKDVLAKKPEAVLALADGAQLRRLYGELAALCERGEVRLKDARVFTVTEFETDVREHSSRYAVEALISGSDLRRENCFFLSKDNFQCYDDMIAAAGGIDLAVLGLGDNAHVGYNEPAVQFNSPTHLQKLAPATMRQLVRRFGSEEIPERAYTMGIRTITQARDILVLAMGEEKAEAAFKMLYGRNDSAVPAAFLQIPLNVTVYLDEAAAGKL